MSASAVSSGFSSRTASRWSLDRLLMRGDTQLSALVVGSALLLGVSYIHLADQGFFAFDKQPGYLLGGYVLIEVLAPIAAIALLRTPSLATWLVALSFGAGPAVGFILTRTTGLPGAMSDKGNWAEPIGVASLIIEGTLVLLAVAEGLRLHYAHRAA